MCIVLITFTFRMNMDKFPSCHCSQISRTVAQENHSESLSLPGMELPHSLWSHPSPEPHSQPVLS